MTRVNVPGSGGATDWKSLEGGKRFRGGWNLRRRADPESLMPGRADVAQNRSRLKR